MKNKNFTKKFLLLCVALVMTFFIFNACDGESDPPGGPDESAEIGPYTKCTYTEGLSDSGYGSAQVFYPCEKTGELSAATTVTSGYSSTKENVYWIAEHLVTHGYIIIAITPTNIYGEPPTWARAHKAGIYKLISENNRIDSPIYGRVDTDKLQVSGHSKGGGGSLIAANDLGDVIASVQAFEPWGTITNLGNVKAAAICYAGGEDQTAKAVHVIKSYNSLPDSIERTYAEFSGVTHKWWEPVTRNRFLVYITSWMKVYLDGDESYGENIIGTQPQWFDEFAMNEDVGTYDWEPTPVEGTFKIVSKLNNGKVMNASGSNDDLILWDWDSGYNEQWILIDLGDGLVNIKSAWNNECLGASASGIGNGTQIIHWECNYNDDQKWSIVPVNGTHVKIKGYQSDRLMNVKGENTGNGTQIILWDDQGGADNELWELIPN